MIHKQEPFLGVLRLLVLFSVTNLGLPKRQFDYLRREILHSYGFEHVVTLSNLERAGLFRKQELKSNWLTIKRAMRLVVEDNNTANPSDISYVFSGYAPLSVRLIQQAIRSGWRPVEDILRLLPGSHSDAKRANLFTPPPTLSSHRRQLSPRQIFLLLPSFNGVGLQTPWGSGSNGYAQSKQVPLVASQIFDRSRERAALVEPWWSRGCLGAWIWTDGNRGEICWRDLGCLISVDEEISPPSPTTRISDCGLERVAQGGGLLRLQQTGRRREVPPGVKLLQVPGVKSGVREVMFNKEGIKAFSV
ncbi:Vacuolar protein-sorting-associated protein 33-like protein [Drosera capensis]